MVIFAIEKQAIATVSRSMIAFAECFAPRPKVGNRLRIRERKVARRDHATPC